MRTITNEFLGILGHGNTAGQTMKDITALTGLSAREVRHAVSELQKNGVPVINMQDGKGYYICEDAHELMKYIKQEHARGIANLARASALNKYLDDKGYEMVGLKIEGLLD